MNTNGCATTRRLRRAARPWRESQTERDRAGLLLRRLGLPGNNAFGARDRELFLRRNGS